MNQLNDEDKLNKILSESLNKFNMESTAIEEDADDDYDFTDKDIPDEDIPFHSDTMRQLLSNALKSLCLTYDHVGSDALPPLKGWNWYDSGKEIADYLWDDEWSLQFRIRAEKYQTKDVRYHFKEGDWVYGIGDNEGCSQVFEGIVGDLQPFSYLGDYDPSNFRIATENEIKQAKNKQKTNN